MSRVAYGTYAGKSDNDRVKTYQKTKEGVSAVIYNTQKRNSKLRGHRPPEYNLKELREWLYSQTKFHELYNEWKLSGYKKNLKPSVDRKHDAIHYCFSNIQLMTWRENNEKSFKTMSVDLSKCKEVHQYTKEGEYVATYHSIAEACKMNKGFGISNIARVARGERKSHKNFLWTYSKIKD